MVGGLKSANVPPRVELSAVDRAFTLVGGWSAKDRGAIGKALADMKAVAEHNQKTYDEAAKALNDLSARDKAVRDGEASLKKAREVFYSSSNQTQDELKGREEAVKADEISLKERTISYDVKIRDATDDLQNRTDDVDAREVVNDRVRKSLEDRENAVRAKEALQAVDAKAIREGLDVIAGASDRLQQVIS